LSETQKIREREQKTQELVKLIREIDKLKTLLGEGNLEKKLKDLQAKADKLLKELTK